MKDGQKLIFKKAGIYRKLCDLMAWKKLTKTKKQKCNGFSQQQCAVK